MSIWILEKKFSSLNLGHLTIHWMQQRFRGGEGRLGYSVLTRNTRNGGRLVCKEKRGASEKKKIPWKLLQDLQ